MRQPSVGQYSGPLGEGVSVWVSTAVGGTGVAVGEVGVGLSAWLVQADSNRASRMDSTNQYLVLLLVFSKPLGFISSSFPC